MKKLYLLPILFPIVCNAIDIKPLHTIILDNKQICRNIDSVYKESDLFYIVQCDNIAGKYIVNRGIKYGINIKLIFEKFISRGNMCKKIASF